MCPPPLDHHTIHLPATQLNNTVTWQALANRAPPLPQPPPRLPPATPDTPSSPSYPAASSTAVQYQLTTPPQLSTVGVPGPLVLLRRLVSRSSRSRHQLGILGAQGGAAGRT
jgi:hypothetical protein